MNKMHPLIHLISGGVFALFCFLFFPSVGVFGAFVLWLSTWFFIDLDHAFRYSVKKKDFSPLNFWKWSKKQGEKWKRLSIEQRFKYKSPLFVFHGIEFLVLIGIFSFFYSVFFFVLVGFIFHLLFDWIDLFLKNESVLNKSSISYVLLKNINKEDFN